MSNETDASASPAPVNRAARILEAGLWAFAATTGALLAFGHQYGSTLGPFAEVGRHVARNVVLPMWGNAAIGLAVHLGHSLALGAIVVLLRGNARAISRVRAALIVALGWQAASLVPWLAVIRPDMAVKLTAGARIGVIFLLAAALAWGTSDRAAPSALAREPLR